MSVCVKTFEGKPDSKEDELTKLRKAAAYQQFFDLKRVQKWLNRINQQKIHCGCPTCLKGNYPTDREGKQERPAGPQVVTNAKCLLLAWFRKQCEAWKVPVPTPHESTYSSLASYLSSNFRYSDGNVGDSWMSIVTKLTYEVQIQTLYPMLHAIWAASRDEYDAYGVEEYIPNFKKWFVTGSDDISLLPKG